MATNEYHFITRWRVEGAAQEVSDVLDDAADLVRWWPDVYLGVEKLEDGDEDGIGKVYRLYTRGRLPYTLQWHFRVVESRKPYGWTLEAWGDFVGRGVGGDVVILGRDVHHHIAHATAHEIGLVSRFAEPMHDRCRGLFFVRHRVTLELKRAKLFKAAITFPVWAGGEAGAGFWFSAAWS